MASARSEKGERHPRDKYFGANRIFDAESSVRSSTFDAIDREKADILRFFDVGERNA